MLITHPGIGSAMLNIATRIMGACCLPTRCIEVPPDVELEPLQHGAEKVLTELDNGDGILILTDMFGATPHNVACRLAGDDASRRVVSGLNLSMLLRVFNYPGDDLGTLVAKALEGGMRGLQVHGN